MVLDRLLGDSEPLTDLPVGQAVTDEVEDLALGVGQVGGGVVVVRPAARHGALVEQDAPGGDGPHNVADLGTVDRLEQVGPGTCRQGLGQGLVVVEGGQHDRQGLGHGVPQLLHELDAGAVGQLEVHEDDVGADQLGPTHRLSPRTRLGDDVEPIGAVNDLGDAATDDLVVVHDHDADDLRRWGVCHTRDITRVWKPTSQPWQRCGDAAVMLLRRLPASTGGTYRRRRGRVWQRGQ